MWTPYVEKEDEYSTSRVVIQNGGWRDFELVETGWAVIKYFLSLTVRITIAHFIVLYV